MLRVVFLLVLLGCPGLAQAARTVTSEGLIPITLELGQPTAVVFPEELSSITTAMPDTRLAISKDNVYAGFVAKDPDLPPSRQVVVGLSGRVYLVVVALAKPGKAGDDLVYVTHKAPVQADILTPLSVLRTLRQPGGLGPAQSLTLPVPTPSDTRVALVQPRQYTLGPYQALVLTVVNTQETPLELDERVGEEHPDAPETMRLATWGWPQTRRLKALALEQPFLAPHGSTTLYAVFEDK